MWKFVAFTSLCGKNLLVSLSAEGFLKVHIFGYRESFAYHIRGNFLLLLLQPKITQYICFEFYGIHSSLALGLLLKLVFIPLNMLAESVYKHDSILNNKSNRWF